MNWLVLEQWFKSNVEAENIEIILNPVFLWNGIDWNVLWRKMMSFTLVVVKDIKINRYEPIERDVHSYSMNHDIFQEKKSIFPMKFYCKCWRFTYTNQIAYWRQYLWDFMVLRCSNVQMRLFLRRSRWNSPMQYYCKCWRFTYTTRLHILETILMRLHGSLP